MQEDQDTELLLRHNLFFMFCATYLPHWFPLKPAEYHKRLFNKFFYGKDFITVLGFRGSAKTTILKAYALYGLVTGTSPLTVVIGANDGASRRLLKDIKTEIEQNLRLQKDYAIPVVPITNRIITEKWSENELHLRGCSIFARSRGQKVRGVNINNSRITQILLDDVEDVESAKREEVRKKTREWFFTEVVPALAKGVMGEETKIIAIGNLVHKACLIAYLDNKDIENVGLVQVEKIPLFDEFGNVAWPALYPTQEYVDKEKSKVMLAGQGMGAVIWAREYLLQTVSEEDQIIKDTDIQYYPDEWLQRPFERGAVGIDLAISLKQTADYTAMVKAVIVRNDYGERRLLILRNPVKERLQFDETISKARTLRLEMPEGTTFYVEDVAYQKASIEMMMKNGINAVGVRPIGDKRSRLIQVSPYIKSGMVLFPNNGVQNIIEEIIGFGIESHDDVLDAFIHAVYNLLNEPEIICV